MKVSNYFNKFYSNIDFSTEKISTIRQRYKKITQIINNEYHNSNSETLNSLYVGSYGRNTKAFNSDIDILVILPYSTYKKFNDYRYNGQSSLLQEVKKIIQKTYHNTKIRGDGQVVQLNFSDGITFEILPVFSNTDGSFTYPDTNNGGSWETTDPKPEIKSMNTMNNNTNQNLKKLCKMIRAWKYTNNVQISGELIDLHAYKFLNTWKYSNESSIYHDWMSRDFFKYLHNIPDNSTHIFPGSYRIVSHPNNIKYKSEIAYRKSVEACNIDCDDYPHTYCSKWKEIYGSKFPSPNS